MSCGGRRESWVGEGGMGERWVGEGRGGEVGREGEGR